MPPPAPVDRQRKATRTVALAVVGAYVASVRPPRGREVADWYDLEPFHFLDWPLPWLALFAAVLAVAAWMAATFSVRRHETPADRQARRVRDGLETAKMAFLLAIPLLVLSLVLQQADPWKDLYDGAPLIELVVAYLAGVVAVSGAWALFHATGRPQPPAAGAPPPGEAAAQAEPEPAGTAGSAASPAQAAPAPRMDAPAPPRRPIWPTRAIAAGMLLPIATAIVIVPLWLADDPDLHDVASAIAFAGIAAGLLLVLGGLAGFLAHRRRPDPAARREAEAALEAAWAEDAEAGPETPTVLLDAPTGLPWDRRR